MTQSSLQFFTTVTVVVENGIKISDSLYRSNFKGNNFQDDKNWKTDKQDNKVTKQITL